MNIKNKLIKFTNLNSLRKKYKSKKIVLAHGTFDFIHIGHINHLEKSKNAGDILVVSLTSDKFVSKGPNRPIYNDAQRVKFLSSIDFVDYIVVVTSLSGVEVIRELKPDIYSKGIEYKKLLNDYTKKISLELKELKKNNGTPIYTNEPTLSSSNLVNRLINIPNNEINYFKQNFIKKNNFDEFKQRFYKIEKKNILVIGEAILDNYIFTSALSKSPKEEIISVKEENTSFYAGGIFATANNISNFVNKVTLISVFNENNILFKKIKNKINKNLKCIFYKDKNVDMSIKKRFLDVSKKKLFQVNNLNFNEIEPNTEKKIINFLKKNLKSFDLVVVNDFGHGLLTKNIINCLEINSKKLAVNVQTNSANFGFNFFDKYSRSYYLTLDEPEVRFALRDRKSSSRVLFKKILKRTKSQIVAITYGSNGTKIFSKNSYFDLPVLSNNVVDSMGAGDAFFAISSIYSLEDSNPENIGFIGNLAGAIKIQNLGHEKFIDKNLLLGYLKSFLA